jgi:hypothetical protein
VCLCHHNAFEERKEIHEHCKNHKRSTGNETLYDKHYRKACGMSSRICRYCHPEKEIVEAPHTYSHHNLNIVDERREIQKQV